MLAAQLDSSVHGQIPLADLSVEVKNLRKAIGDLAAHTQRLADQYKKNAGVQDCLRFLERALTSISDEDENWPDRSVKIDWVEFGKVLKVRRKSSGMGIKEVAEMAGISESMFRFIETAEKRPSLNLVRQLLMIPRLNLRMDDILGESSGDSVIPTVWFAPHYDPRQMIVDLVAQLNGAGCSLEQTGAYLDYQSADDWLTTCNAPSYRAAFSNTAALEMVAKQIAESCGAGGLDVIAIGSGDAKREVKFVECLLEHTRNRNIKDIRLFLVDISHSLLTEAHNHARNTLGNSVKHIVALHGNFHDLSQFPLFSHADRRSRSRVFTLLGCTLVNLDNEFRFFRDTMNAASPDDFFLADYTNAYASPDDAEQIRALDPPLTTGVQPTHKTWLGGPIRRYTKGVNTVDFSVELNTDCIVPGSYELAFIANVTLGKGEQSRRFVTWRVRRYDPALLEECLARAGWKTELRIPYGGNERQRLNLMLLRKLAG